MHTQTNTQKEAPSCDAGEDGTFFPLEVREKVMRHYCKATKSAERGASYPNKRISKSEEAEVMKWVDKMLACNTRDCCYFLFLTNSQYRVLLTKTTDVLKTNK